MLQALADRARHAAGGPAAGRAAEPARLAGDRARAGAARQPSSPPSGCQRCGRARASRPTCSSTSSALHDELRRRDERFAATPEAARRANVELRRSMREQDNYFPACRAGGRAGARAPSATASGALPQRAITDLAAHFGFTLHNVTDLPESTRSVADLVNRRIYLPQRPAGHDPRYVVLQTLGHFALGHTDPSDFAEFLRQRVEANYFAAALLVPEKAAAQFLLEAKRDRALSMEDLRDVFAVSHETAAHRFTNLATHHLGLQVHFTRTDSSGTIYKAYENDGLPYPTDAQRRDRRPARLPAVHQPPRLRVRRPLRVLHAVHRHSQGHVLLHGARRAGRRRGVRRHRRRAVPAREVVPRCRHPAPAQVRPARHRRAAAGRRRARGEVGRPGLAVGASPQPPARRASARHLPRRRHDRRLRLPRTPRPP